jgi:hypothetical protein
MWQRSTPRDARSTKQKCAVVHSYGFAVYPPGSGVVYDAKRLLDGFQKKVMKNRNFPRKSCVIHRHLVESKVSVRRRNALATGFARFLLFSPCGYFSAVDVTLSSSRCDSSSSSANVTQSLRALQTTRNSLFDLHTAEELLDDEKSFHRLVIDSLFD